MVDDIFFDIYKGEIFGLVGEFGCGKFIIGCIIICLYDVIGGEVIYNGKDVYVCKSCKEMFEFCCKM